MRQATPAEIELVWACGYSGRDDTPRASKTKAIGDNAADRKILDQAIAIVAKARGLKVPQELIVSTRSGVSLVRVENAHAPMPGRVEIARAFSEALEAFQGGRQA